MASEDKNVLELIDNLKTRQNDLEKQFSDSLINRNNGYNMPIEILNKFSKMSQDIEQLVKLIPNYIADSNIDIIKTADEEVKYHEDFMSVLKNMNKTGSGYDYRFSTELLEKGIMFTRTGISVASNIPGASIASGRTWFALKQANPFRPYIDIYTLLEGAAKSPKLPALGANQPEQESSIPNIGTTDGYDVTNGDLGRGDTINLIPRPIRYPVSEKALMNIISLNNAILMFILNTISYAQGKSIVATIKALAPNSGIVEVTSGVDDDLPASNMVLAKMNDLFKLSASFIETPGCCWQVSTELDNLLRVLQITTDHNIWTYDNEGQRYLLGKPYHLNDSFDAAAADAIFALFGNFRQGVILYENPEIIIRLAPQTSPGQVIYTSNHGWNVEAKEHKAVSRMIEGV